MKRSGNVWYHRESMWVELHASLEWFQRNNTVFHFTYGENLYRYAGLLAGINRRRNALIATYHTPGWRIRELITNPKHIQRLDGVVMMSNSQNEYFEQVAPNVPRYFVPHGVDIDYFEPSRNPPPLDRALNLICVGAHLRDFKTLAGMARVVLENKVPVEITVVCNPAKATELSNISNVRLLSGLSDADLRKAYQSSHGLLLPLRDATANNSLLEALACGLPVISTDLEGVRDYTNSDCAVLAPPGEIGALADIVTMAARGGLDLRAMGTASRLLAKQFSWASVRERLVEVHRKVLSY